MFFFDNIKATTAKTSKETKKNKQTTNEYQNKMQDQTPKNFLM